MAKCLELDKNINPLINVDQQPSYEKYQEDIQAFSEEERLASVAPDVPVLDPIDQMTEIKKDMADTVHSMIHSFYCRHRVELTQMSQFIEFSQAMLKTPMFELTGSLTYKALDIVDAGHVYFDFVEMEDPEIAKHRKKPENIIQWLGTLSSSLK